MNYYVKNEDELRAALKEAENISDSVCIYLEAEHIFLSKPVVFNRSDIKVIGKNTVISGAKRIYLDSDNKCVIDLKKYGITKFSELSEGPFKDFWVDYEIPKPYMCEYGMGTEIFYEDMPLTIARYPKKGFMQVEKVFGKTEKYCPMGKFEGYLEGVISLKDEKFWEWDNKEDIIFVGYWMYDWALQRQRIESIDEKNKTITLKQPFHYFGYKDNANLYVINVKSEVTERGDWYLDRKNGLLYIYPLRNQKYIDVSIVKNIFEANNQTNIKIENVILEKCCETGIIFQNCINTEVKDCVIKNTGAWGAISENCAKAVYDNVTVYQTGGGGISVSGGDRNTLKSSENVIKNCTVWENARWHRTYLPALQVCGVGGIVSGNKIYDVPHFGIVFHGNNHIIEKNEISNACYESNDAGAIYSGKDWSCRGNIIRENYFHDIKGFKNKGCIAVYFDDAMSSAEVYSNIFANITGTGVLIGGGRDFYVHDNIFFNVKNTVTVDDRLDNWGKPSIPIMINRLNAVDYKNDIWKKAYPKLYNILESNYHLPENNIIMNNTVISKDKK